MRRMYLPAHCHAFCGCAAGETGENLSPPLLILRQLLLLLLLTAENLLQFFVGQGLHFAYIHDIFLLALDLYLRQCLHELREKEKPKSNATNMYSSEKRGRIFGIACSNTPPLFQF